MSKRLAEKYATRGARLTHQFVLMDEERRPLPEDPTPAMLVARVNERLIQAACAIEWELEDEDADPDGDGLLQVAVYFIGATGFALTAIAHLHGDPDELTRCKDRLMEQLDVDVAGHLDASADFYESATPDKLLKCCMALMLGACQCVAELEGVNSLPAGEDDGPPLTVDDVLGAYDADTVIPDEDDDEDELSDEWRDDLLEQVADSLWQTAVATAAAAQWLVELDESD